MAQSTRLEVVHEPSQFAIEFCELYVNIIPNLYNIKCRTFFDDFLRELKSIKQLECDIVKDNKKQHVGYLNFKEIAVRCAYMYSYSVLNTSIAYREFSNHLKMNENILLQHFSSKTLKLCCLGGGPGTEAVGVSKAIHNMFWKSKWEDVKSIVDVHVTIVDICMEWKSEQSAIANALHKNSQLFHSRKVNFHVDYFEADLLNPFEKTLQNIIKEAEVITIVNLANAVQEKGEMDCMTKIEGLIKSVIDCMAEDSCLFMLERPGTGVFTLERAGARVFYRIPEAICKYRSDFKLQMFLNKTYNLHPKTLMQLGNVINVRRFVGNAAMFPMQSKKVSSCIWIKNTRHPELKKEKKEEEEKIGKTEAEKEKKGRKTKIKVRK